MKKIIAFLLAGLMCLCTVGCAKSKENVTSTTTPIATDTAQISTTKSVTTSLVNTTATRTIATKIATVTQTDFSKYYIKSNYKLDYKDNNSNQKEFKCPTYLFTEDFEPYFNAETSKEQNKFAEDFLSTLRVAKDNKDYVISDFKEGICINDYVGDKAEVVIPEMLEGKPVVKLGEFFVEDDEGEDAYIPHTPFLNEIYSSTSTKKVVLPSKLKYISHGALSGIKNIEVSKDNPYYSSLSGALYSKDMSTLYCTPGGKTKYVAPEGVKYIPGFGLGDIYNIYLSSTVEKIEENIDVLPERITVSENNKNYSSIDYALYNKDKTELIYYGRARTYKMPESVEKIKYSWSIRSFKIKLNSKIKLEEGFLVDNYGSFDSVDSKNPYYSIKDGCLYDKDYTKLLRFSEQENIEIPETVTTIGEFAFLNLYNNGENTKVKVGENVKKIIVNDRKKALPRDLTIEGKKGSVAEALAKYLKCNFVDTKN